MANRRPANRNHADSISYGCSPEAVKEVFTQVNSLDQDSFVEGLIALSKRTDVVRIFLPGVSLVGKVEVSKDKKSALIYDDNKVTTVQISNISSYS